MSMTTGNQGPLRVGIIGCGDAARRVHLPALEAAGAQVIRFASKDLADAQAAADAARHEAMATDDWRQLVASAHIDAVDICTPTHLHAEMAMAAIDQGKHVLVESPMTLTAKEADALLKAAARKGVMLIPAHSVRFIGAYHAAAEAARSGVLGTLAGARIEFGHPGRDQLQPHAEWYLEKSKSGGGALMDLGPAMVDLIRLSFGEEITGVSATVAGERGEVETAAEVRLMLASGVVVEMAASWDTPANLVRITGSEAVALIDTEGPPRISWLDGRVERLRAPATGADGIESVFVEAVASGIAPTVNALDGRAAVAVVTAAYESAATGEPVEVAPPTW